MAELMIDVEVAYARPEEQVILAFKVPAGSSVEQAIKTSGILLRFPEIELAGVKAGIFGNVCSMDQRVRQADRVEIYRPLVHDPKEARRQRAAKG